MLWLSNACLLQGRMDAARALFHDAEKTQFVIVTIPTLMAAAESARLARSLRQEGIPIETLIVNQVGVAWGSGMSRGRAGGHIAHDYHQLSGT
jgi:anion-transporting  ArsA/GET3 family ATPase